MTAAGAPAPQAREAQMPVPSPAQVLPYHPPPSYPPPTHQATVGLDTRALIALAVAVAGLLLGLPLGVPGLVCGPIAYFMGRSAVSRIEASSGAVAGRNIAVTAWVLGIVATAVGAVITLSWFVVFLVWASGPTTS